MAQESDNVVDGESPKKAPHSSHEGLGNIVSTILILVIAPVIALLLTAFVFQSYQVDGPSMQTTLFNNDRLIVWKLPRTWARLTGHAYVPKRGDIVIFSDSILASYGQDPDKQLIKRVVGLPGDRLVVKNGVVTIYNKQHPHGFDPDKTLPYGADNHIPDTAGNIDITIPAGDIYVMGDNRPDSLDSRTFGPVPVKNIVGQLVLRVWPAEQAKRF